MPFRDWDRRFGKMGDAVKEMLYDFSREAFVQKQNNIDLRMREIMPDLYNGKLENDISVKNIKLDGVGKDGRAHEVSKAVLMALYIGIENTHFKAHYIYGNMMSAAQRSQMRADFEQLTSDQYIKIFNS
ncbi:MAG: hypothetical protein Ta2B_24580 [Termitinemataceae bacterium]|nr:MAG: hypothetical protein Ta2B_24580 [Termitinemataceae bacterium]